jgi:hypothetical protein
MNRVTSILSMLLFAALCGGLGCAGIVPPKSSAPAFMRAAEIKEEDNLRVAVAVLTPAESEEYFGFPLEAEGVQAVWLSVENRNAFAVWILPRFTDPDYFSALEIAYQNHSGFSAKFNQKIDFSFHQYAIRWRVAPGKTNAGFLFVNLSEGAKFVNVELWHSKGLLDVGFYLELPNGAFDYEQADLTKIYRPSQVKDLTISQLRQVLETLPCCTDNRRGVYGDPLNIVLIGSTSDIFSALVRQGWDPTHALRAASIRRTLGAFLLGSRYRYAPVSSLYVFGRRQDAAFQKARETIHQRNHMRLWLSPYTYRGKPVWVGQISRDIGVRFTLQSPFLTTHKIDPEVDDARDYLVQDLLASESLEWLAFVKGVGPATASAPRENLTGDEYSSDGMRAVVAISSGRVPASAVSFVRWEALPNE